MTHYDYLEKRKAQGQKLSRNTPSYSLRDYKGELWLYDGLTPLIKLSRAVRILDTHFEYLDAAAHTRASFSKY